MACVIKDEMCKVNSGLWKNGGEKVAHCSFTRASKRYFVEGVGLEMTLAFQTQH